MNIAKVRSKNDMESPHIGNYKPNMRLSAKRKKTNESMIINKDLQSNSQDFHTINN